jgi:hypothetical protein
MIRAGGDMRRRPTNTGPRQAVATLAIAAALMALAACSSSGGDAATAYGAHPFEHVYHPQRLKVLDKCRTITGVIEHVKREPDGDAHIRLRADDASLLNQKNIDDQQGDLVLEPVCVGTVTQEDAKDACADYHSDVTVPATGTRVTVTGPWVLDKQHGWNEIHPVVVMAAEAEPAPR